MTVHTMESVLSYCMEWMCFLPRGKNEPLRCCVFELHRIDVKMYCIENVTYVMKICIENEIMNHVLHVHHNWLNCVGWKFHEWMNRWRHKHIHLVLPWWFIRSSWERAIYIHRGKLSKKASCQQRFIPKPKSKRLPGQRWSKKIQMVDSVYIHAYQGMAYLPQHSHLTLLIRDVILLQSLSYISGL